MRVASIRYAVEKADRPEIAGWIGKLLDRAYGAAKRLKRIKVLINPFGGTGTAAKLFRRDIEPIFAAAGCVVDIEQTQYQGHAVEIGQKLDINAHDVVACCSGDGVPHEIFNGLGKRQDAKSALAKVAVVQLPCGTGNAMSWNLNGTDSPTMAALCVVKGLRTPLDLVSITQGDRRTLSFLSQSVGIVAESDLGTEHLRWMGSARFTVGFLTRLLGKTLYPSDVAVMVKYGDKAGVREHYRQEIDRLGHLGSTCDDKEEEGQCSGLSASSDCGLPPLKFATATSSLPSSWSLNPYPNLGNFYAGNMSYMSPDANFFPAALPSDGCIDLICIDGDIPRLAALKSLAAIEKGTFFDMDHVNYRKVIGYRIVPKAQKEGCISIDGERIPFEPFQAEVHQGLGTVLARRRGRYEARGPDERS